jgi:hypothetical protein
MQHVHVLVHACECHTHWYIIANAVQYSSIMRADAMHKLKSYCNTVPYREKKTNPVQTTPIPDSGEGGFGA